MRIKVFLQSGDLGCNFEIDMVENKVATLISFTVIQSRKDNKNIKC